jgi:putative tricarboxylic transport membrane protein
MTTTRSSFAIVTAAARDRTVRATPRPSAGLTETVTMTKRSTTRLMALGAAALIATTGCAASSSGSNSDAKDAGPLTGLRVMVPNSPGSGYDTTARTAAKAMEDAGLAENVEVFNLAGAGGTVGLQRVVNEKGNGKLIMQMGLGVVGASYTNKSKATLTETTPLAKLIEETEAIAVPKNSSYKTLADFLAAWRANPGKVPVGGGSSPGGPDYLAPMLTAKAAGIEPKKVNFISYDGGGELLAALLGSKVKAAFTGTSEVEEQVKAGQLRVLAVTSAEKVSSLPDAPTLKESGVDLVFSNWRGLVAPPGVSATDRTTLIAAVDKLHQSQQWKDAVATKGWTDAYVSGEDFSTFLTAENERVGAILTELGLA